LLKQVKITAKCTQVSHSMIYGGGTKRIKTVIDELGNKQEIIIARKGKLNAEDN